MLNRQHRLQIRLVIAVSVLLSVVFSGCGSRPADTGDTLIYGGTPVAPGDWNAIVGLATSTDADEQNYRLVCTGVLIHKRAVLTAGHCLKDVSSQTLRIYVGNGQEGGGIQTAVKVDRIFWQEQLRQHPLGYADIGIVTLTNDLIGVQPIEPVTGLAATLALSSSGQRIRLVGFGEREDGGVGLKYEVETSIKQSGSHEIIAGGDGKDACVGDSGGPALVQLADGQWRLLGVISRGVQLGCGGGGYIALAADSACWIERTAGILLPDQHDRCLGDVPQYDPAQLAEVTFSQLCAAKDLQPTQRETFEAIFLATATTNCQEAEAALAGRRKLSLTGLMIRDASPLATLRHVEYLSLRGNRLQSVASLRGLTSLKVLDLVGNDVRDAGALATLEANGLVVLGKRRQVWNLAQTNFLALCRDPTVTAAAHTTLQAVFWSLMTEDCDRANERLLNLRSLDLSGRNLTDLSPLSDLQHLEILDLSGNPALTDISPLAGLESLKQLDLRGTTVVDLGTLSGLVSRGLSVATDTGLRD